MFIPRSLFELMRKIIYIQTQNGQNKVNRKQTVNCNKGKLTGKLLVYRDEICIC